MEVRRVARDVWLPWVLYRHYARRRPHTVMDAFGLFDDDECLGIVTYSIPTSPQIVRSVVSERYRRIVRELSRLALASHAPRNAASTLVGRSLRELERPTIVVSYADAEIGHVGYVYQAANFTYCGVGTPSHHIRLKTGEQLHPRSIVASGISTAPKRWARENGHEVVETLAKHRYVKVVASRADKKRILAELKWTAHPFPKGDSRKQHVDDAHPEQSAMF